MNLIILLCILLVLAFISWLLRKKVNNELAQKYLDYLDETILSCVLTTTQTYVQELKSQGLFNEEAQKTAFQKSYESIMKCLTEDGIKLITSLVGDLETYISNKIERAVYENK